MPHEIQGIFCWVLTIFSMFSYIILVSHYPYRELGEYDAIWLVLLKVWGALPVLILSLFGFTWLLLRIFG